MDSILSSELNDPDTELQILHAFADHGVESSVLSEYGTVTRITIDPVEYEHSTTIQADLEEILEQKPIKAEFDFGLLHPPCTKWSDMPSADTEEATNLIPVAREFAQEYCTEYIIENKPRAPLEDPVLLNGKQFGLPIEYERAFETSFEIPTTPDEQNIETEISPYFYSDRSKQWWAAVKGYSTQYPKAHLAKNCVPRPYIEFFVRNFLEQYNRRDADYARSSHNDTTPLRISSD